MTGAAASSAQPQRRDSLAHEEQRPVIGMIERSVPTKLDHPNVGYGRIRRDSGLPSGTRDS